MKKLKQFIWLAIMAFAVVISSCTKEGPMGPAGADGANGTDGKDGVDGNVTCLECHTSELQETVRFQFNSSAHKAGAIAVDYAGGRASCARCHSHEGFIEFAATGTVAANISNPSAWDCKTCHGLHEQFETADYAFRLGDPVTLIADGTTVVDEGNNNTCVNCHQSRRNGSYYDSATEPATYTRTFSGDDATLYANAAVGPNGSVTDNGDGTITVVFDVPTTHVYISSTHAGPHYGAQANTFVGTGGYTAEAGDVFGAHADGCVMCHMGPASGHSFVPEDENCTTCHTSGVPTAAMDAIAARVQALGEALEAIHAVHFDDTDGSWHPMYASITREQFQAFWNFKIVLDDRSNSAHNPVYVKALLTEAEATMQ